MHQLHSAQHTPQVDRPTWLSISSPARSALLPKYTASPPPRPTLSVKSQLLILTVGGLGGRPGALKPTCTAPPAPKA